MINREQQRAKYVVTIETLERKLRRTTSPEWADHYKRVLKGHYERLAAFDAAR